MTSNSLTENEEQDIPSHNLKTTFGLHASVIFKPKYVWFPVHLNGPKIPASSGQLAELIVYITSTRVHLYNHQLLLPHGIISPKHYMPRHHLSLYQCIICHCPKP